MIYYMNKAGATIRGRFPSHISAKYNADGDVIRWERTVTGKLSIADVQEIECVQADGTELEFALNLLNLPHVPGVRVRCFVGDQARTIALNI